MRRLGASLIIAVPVLVTPSYAVRVESVAMHLRWAPGVINARCIERERRCHLRDGSQTEGTTWSYRLAGRRIPASTADFNVLVALPASGCCAVADVVALVKDDAPHSRLFLPPD